MAHERLVAVSYPVDGEFTSINADVLGDLATLSYTDGMPEDERAEVLRQAEVLIGLRLQREVPAGALQSAPGLRFIQMLSAGLDTVDFDVIAPDIMVAGNVGAYAHPIAEHVMAMVLCLAKRLPQENAALARGEWTRAEGDRAAATATLDGAVCAILGYGGIGRATARLMRAFGARIHAINSSGHTDDPVEFCGTLDDLDRVLAAADVLVIGIPLTAGTRGLIGPRELGLMKDSAILINVARGAIVDERALYEHLRATPGFSAGIDAWWDEPRGGAPFRTNYPFFELPNLLGSPHNSGDVPGIMYYAARQAAANVRRYLIGDAVSGVARREDYAKLP
jgi:phosphoglycerate dehydrogenase-like enzyme